MSAALGSGRWTSLTYRSDLLERKLFRPALQGHQGAGGLRRFRAADGEGPVLVVLDLVRFQEGPQRLYMSGGYLSVAGEERRGETGRENMGAGDDEDPHFAVETGRTAAVEGVADRRTHKPAEKPADDHSRTASALLCCDAAVDQRETQRRLTGHRLQDCVDVGLGFFQYPLFVLPLPSGPPHALHSHPRRPRTADRDRHRDPTRNRISFRTFCISAFPYSPDRTRCTRVKKPCVTGDITHTPPCSAISLQARIVPAFQERTSPVFLLSRLGRRP